MKYLVLFFKDLKQAIKDSGIAILILLLSCMIGVIGVGFCYRTAVFEMRQPASNYMYAGQNAIAYSIHGQEVGINQNIDIKGYLGIDGSTEILINEKNYKLNLFDKDFYNEGIIEFVGKGNQIVVNEDIGLEVGTKVSVFGMQLEVAGKTQNDSYTNIYNFDRVAGNVIVYFDRQLKKSEIVALEKTMNGYMERDLKWSGKFTPEQYVFMVLGGAIIVLIAINIFRLLNLYLRKNKNRYQLYCRIGMSKNRLLFVIFGEVFLIFLMSLPISLILDYFVFRPIVKIVGLVFMYDIIDFIIISSCVLVPFLMVLLIRLLMLKLSDLYSKIKKVK